MIDALSNVNIYVLFSVHLLMWCIGIGYGLWLTGVGSRQSISLRKGQR